MAAVVVPPEQPEGLVARPFRRSGCSRAGEGDCQCEDSSFCGCAALEHEAPAVMFRQLAADVKAEPDAWDLGDRGVRAPIKTGEDLVALILGDADAVVLHTDHSPLRVPRHVDEKASRRG